MKKLQILCLGLIICLGLVACQSNASNSNTLVIYSGRTEALIGPLIEKFQNESGITVQVKYGKTGELAATLQEEGQNSPADLFYAQDPGGLGAVADAGLFSVIPETLTSQVQPGFADAERYWIGVSGRARVLIYNTDLLSASDLPADILGLTDAKWQGKIGVAPSNASFQSMVTAMHKIWGEEKTLAWLQGMAANQPVLYDSNDTLAAGVGKGEVSVGLVNHYYVYEVQAEQGETLPVANYFFDNAGPESLVMVSGVGQLKSAKNAANAQKFIEFLLSSTTQQYFINQTWEYSVLPGLAAQPELPALASLHAPTISLSDLKDMVGTEKLLQKSGLMP
jgi:iron(III) transport system substrate-binding protein